MEIIIIFFLIGLIVGVVFAVFAFLLKCAGVVFLTIFAALADNDVIKVVAVILLMLVVIKFIF